jgi:hypothetical protein
MDPYSAAAGLANTALNLYGAHKQRKQQEKASKLIMQGVADLKGGKGYNADQALRFLGLTDKSAYADMDPASKQATMQALKQLVTRGSGSGLDVQSKVALDQAMRRSGAAQNAARQAIISEYANRGAGGGAELAAQMQGLQQNYGNTAEATGAAAAAAEQRRLEANVLASRAGQQQQQLEQQTAAAYDALRRFNVGAKQNVLDLEKQYRMGAMSGSTAAGQALYGGAANVGRPYSTAGALLQNSVAPMVKGFATGDWGGGGGGGGGYGGGYGGGGGGGGFDYGSDYSSGMKLKNPMEKNPWG